MVLDWSLLMFAIYAVVMLATYPADKLVFRSAWLTFSVVFVCLCLKSGDLVALLPGVVFAASIALCRRKRIRFLPFFGIAAVILVVTTLVRLPRIVEVAELLHEYPPVSLVDRLKNKPESSTPSDLQLDGIAERTKKEFREIEVARSQRKSRRFASLFRERVLGQLSFLHRRSLKIFSDAPGFGVSRVRRMPIRRSFVRLDELPSDFKLTAYGAAELNDSTNQFRVGLPSGTDFDAVRRLHIFSVSDFMNSEGFGYVPNSYRQSDLTRVVGFQSHGFREQPEPVAGKQSSWQVVNLDLVSLWLNDPPAVYVSENLPQMGELTSAPTRPLNSFESESLKKIKAEEWLFPTDFKSDFIRMMGPIRAGEKCRDCHDVPVGHLLGAFSYVLSRNGNLANAN